MAKASEKYTGQEAKVWLDPAEAVIYLRDGITPSSTDPRLGVQTAINEIRQLNAAIQAGKIDVIELNLDGIQSQLPTEDKACMELRFRLTSFGGPVGVKTEVVDTRTNEPRKGIKNWLLRAEDVCSLREPVKSDQTASPSVEPFRTGAPGRPTASHLVLTEAANRISDGKVTRRRGGLAALAEELQKWWEEERKKSNPPGPPLSQGTIENKIRDLWNDSMSRGSSSDET